jgi:hypothetical protein
LVRQFKDQALVVISLGFFALSWQLIYYSAELKQYSLDLFMGLVLYLVFSSAIKTQLDLKKIIMLSFLGCLFMWVSNVIVFVLAAFGATLTLFCVQEKRWKQLGLSVIVYVCWLASFAVLYKIFLSNMATNTTLFKTWPGAVLEAPLLSKEACLWIRDVFLKMFSDPLGFSFTGLAFVLFVVGVASLIRQRSVYAFLFIFSILVALLAAILHKYPFRGRLLLFLFPGVLIFVVQGLLVISRKVLKDFSVGIVILFCCLLFVDPFFKTVQGFSKDYCREENREAISFVNAHYQKGDFVLLNSAAQFPFWYYGSQLKLARFFEERWAGMDKGVMKTGVKVAKFWEGMKESQGKKFTFFRYEYNVYDKEFHYVKSLIPVQLTENDIYFLFEDLPFSYPVEGQRLWLILGDPSVDFERIATGSLGLRFPKLAEFKRKGISVYLYQAK